jgi:hypothetical protein
MLLALCNMEESHKPDVESILIKKHLICRNYKLLKLLKNAQFYNVLL